MSILSSKHRVPIALQGRALETIYPDVSWLAHITHFDATPAKQTLVCNLKDGLNTANMKAHTNTHTHTHIHRAGNCTKGVPLPTAPCSAAVY